LALIISSLGQWGDHEIDGKISYRGMQPTCSRFGTGRLQQEIRRSGGRRLRRPWPENGPKRHRRRRISSFDSGLAILPHHPSTVLTLYKPPTSQHPSPQFPFSPEDGDSMFL
jgi:hypothetical protein